MILRENDIERYDIEAMHCWLADRFDKNSTK
jgi:hypothetical protein